MQNLEYLRFQFNTINLKFHVACKQLVAVNNNINMLQARYDRANTTGMKSFRYSLRLKLAVLEGLRTVMYEYACRQADNLDELECKISQLEDTMSGSDYESDDDLYTLDERMNIERMNTV